MISNPTGHFEPFQGSQEHLESLSPGFQSKPWAEICEHLRRKICEHLRCKTGEHLW